MKLIVDHAPRFAKMRAHTATHLLHAQLAAIFPETKQAGSLVDDDVVRFDFHADRLLAPSEITQIEKNINQIIFDALPVVTIETSMAEASKLGAKAFFEDKYGDVVRVVRVTRTADRETDNISAELCGGTHSENTKDIGCFAIVSQEAVASGVKRISAITGPKVSERMQELQAMLDTTVEKLGIKTHTQLADKLEKTLKEYDEMKSAIESLENKIVHQLLTGKDFASGKDLDKVFKVPADLNFKNVAFQAKALLPEQNILIYTDEGSFVLLTKTGTSAKDMATKLGIKGGGNEATVQGRDEKVLSLFA